MTEGKRGCFKYGCLGCGVVVGLPLVVLVVLLGLGLATGGREERIERLSRTHEVRSAAAPPTRWAEGIEVPEPARILLDLTRGSFEIRPGQPGESLRLEGRYDEGRYRLEEKVESYGETGFIYRVTLEERGFGLVPFIQRGPAVNDLRLILPPDVPIVLEGKIGLAESDLELGGLWLIEVDLELGIGEHGVAFSKPLPAAMKRFRLDGSIGEIEVHELGNASPRSVEITRSVGAMFLDLDGTWQQDSEIDVRCGIGECRLSVPDHVGIDFRGGDVFIGESNLGWLQDRPAAAAGAPVLSLSVAGTLGEIRVER